MYNIAVVLAAGNGTRMGIDKSKLLIDIGGKTVIERSVAVFENMAEIDEIIVVCRECDVEIFSKLLPQENITFVIGGETRQQSVKNAVETIDDCDYIIIHDGARPLVTPETVVKTLDEAQIRKAAATGVFVKDTVKVVDESLNIVGTPNRKILCLFKLRRFLNLIHIKMRLKPLRKTVKIIRTIASLLSISALNAALLSANTKI